MRKAAGILLIIGGMAVAFPNMTLSTPPLVWFFAALAVIIFIVGGGISAMRGRAYRWAVAATICAMVMALFIAVYEAHGLYRAILPRFSAYRDFVPGVLMPVAAGVLFGLPGVLAHIFLVKRKGEFQA